MQSSKVRALVLGLLTSSLLAVTPVFAASAEAASSATASTASISAGAASAAASSLEPGSCVWQTSSDGASAAVGPASSVVAATPGTLGPPLVESLVACSASFVQALTFYTPVSSPFGMRVHPITGATTMHYGTDYARSGIRDAAIRSVAAGTVVASNESYAPTGTGNAITVAHDGNVRSQYMHMAAPSAIPVGSRVEAGQTLGYVGSTGGSTGPHLHLEIRVNNVHVDPFVYLRDAPFLQ